MKERIRKWWDKHEIWLAPGAMFMFLVAGVQVGVWIGTAKVNESHVTQVYKLNEQISEKDNIIQQKDERIRLLTDSPPNGEIIEAVKAAAKAAETSAESAKKLSEQQNGTPASSKP